MGGIFSSLDVARKALWSSQIAIDVTSHNIANVNTPGYSRQRVDLASSTPIDVGFGPMGTGVIADKITRTRNLMLDNNLRQAYTRQGYANSENSILSEIDIILREPGDSGLANIIGDFFNEWSNAANNPENTSTRDVLLQKGTTMASAFNRIYQQLNNSKAQITYEVTSSNNKINQLTGQISDLNRKISYSEVGGEKANDLRDKRDFLIDQLSEFGKVDHVESSQGMYNVTFEGVTLVSGSQNSEIESEEFVNALGEKELQIKFKNSDQTFSVSGGKMGSLLKQYNQFVPEQMEKLNTLADTISNEVNKIHSASYGLPQGTPPSASTGINFFSGSGAATLKVHQDVLSNTDNIAFSVSGEPGDTEAAITIANLADATLINNESFIEFYNSMASQIGLEIENASTNVAQEDLVVSQMETLKDSYSGVNLDEEMINLTKYQRSFEAASKIIKTIDEMMQTIVNLK